MSRLHPNHLSRTIPSHDEIVAPSQERSIQWTRALDHSVKHLTASWRRSTGSSDCSTDNSGQQCEKPSSSNSLSLPVALGVVIPIAVAIVLFVWLHRRHVKKLRKEDLNDPHKSLDFGWDPASQAKLKAKQKSRKGKKQPEMTVADLGTEKRSLHDRGLSMDMDLGSPYVLPPGLNHSHESLHSMSRSIPNQDDRYRPATTYNPTDSGSMRSMGTRRGRTDDSSSLAGSSSRRVPGDEMKQDLLANAHPMSRSVPPTNRTPDVPEIRMPEAAKDVPRKALPSSPAVPSSNGLAPGAPHLDARDSYVTGDEGGLRRSNTYLAKYISSGNSSATNHQQSTLVQNQHQRNGSNRSALSTDKELPEVPPPTLQTNNRKSPPPAINTETIQQEALRPPRQQSLHASAQPSLEQNFLDDASDYGEALRVQPPSPHDSQQDQNNEHRRSSQAAIPANDEKALGVDDGGLGYDVRRLSMGMRPLPPEDPTDNAEQRANRIRSFYKEYFDDSKPGPAPAAAPAPTAPGGYYEDYDENYLGDGATYFDPVSSQFITSGPEPPYAEPYPRRAMTPPPRTFGGRGHAATFSAGSRLMPPGPRAFSSASGRFVPPGRGIPQKKLPPPGPLRQIPTPHMLREDAFALPIDFAPPSSARDRQAGRPDSPRGGLRPYSPAVPVHNPLVSSYDDLAVMPSPHLLRKSGTFTGLDFAPPPRIKTSDDGRSDDGRSIRSNRSAMSARQQHALRAGAYRVSRIPKEVVGTKNDFMTALKPQWNMHNNDSRVGMDPKLGGAMVL